MNMFIYNSYLYLRIDLAHASTRVGTPTLSSPSTVSSNSSGNAFPYRSIYSNWSCIKDAGKNVNLFCDAEKCRNFLSLPMVGGKHSKQLLFTLRLYKLINSQIWRGSCLIWLKLKSRTPKVKARLFKRQNFGSRMVITLLLRYSSRNVFNFPKSVDTDSNEFSLKFNTSSFFKSNILESILFNLQADTCRCIREDGKLVVNGYSFRDSIISLLFGFSTFFADAGARTDNVICSIFSPTAAFLTKLRKFFNCNGSA